MRKRFALGMVIYALVFLAITAVGMKVLWNYIDAYEQSRPMNTVKAYVSSVTTQDMWDGSEDLLDTLDENVRSREDSRDLIAQGVLGKVFHIVMPRRAAKALTSGRFTCCAAAVR